MLNFFPIHIDKKSKSPIYQQLGDALHDLIEQEILKPNMKLPPIRTFAEHLKINNVTVVNAYKYLENKGVVYSQMGSGTYVSPLPIKETPSSIFLEQLDSNEKDLTTPEQNTINFVTLSPPTDLFPVDDFKALFNTVLERDKGNAFNYQESQGYLPLRESVCDYLHHYGIQTSPDKIQIISGAQQGIDILSKALLRYGDILFVESPTYHGAIAAFQSRGGRIIEIPIEKDGMDLKVLENYMKLYHPKFIYVMTYFQNPTGISYSVDKKRALLNLAEQYDTYIIEDDYLSDFTYSSRPIVSLKALDHRNRVIYIKSFSKILMPGLRLGFLVLPKSILQSVLSAKHTSDISTSGIIQRTFDLYLRSDLWKKHSKDMQNIYKDRYACLLTEIENLLLEYVSYIPPEGGLSIWLQLKDHYSIEEICNRLLSYGVIVSPGSLFSFNTSTLPYIRISFATVDNEHIKKGIQIFYDVLKEYQENNKKGLSH